MEGYTTKAVGDTEKQHLRCEATRAVTKAPLKKSERRDGVGFTESPSKVRINESLETEGPEVLHFQPEHSEESQCTERQKQEQTFTILGQPSPSKIKGNQTADCIDGMSAKKNYNVSDFLGNHDGPRHLGIGVLSSGALDKVDVSETDFSMEYLQPCDRCGERIRVWDMMTHSDYHLALELQNNISGRDFAKPSTVKKQDMSCQKRGAVAPARGQESKRGRQCKHSSAAGESSRMRKLDSYFTAK